MKLFLDKHNGSDQVAEGFKKCWCQLLNDIYEKDHFRYFANHKAMKKHPFSFLVVNEHPPPPLNNYSLLGICSYLL